MRPKQPKTAGSEMPPRTSRKKLKTVKPTDAEVAKARARLQDPSKRASDEATFRRWLRDNPDKEVSVSRGDLRQEYLLLFVVHKMREHGTFATERTVLQSHQEIDSIFWWTEETMKMKLGEMKTKAIIDSKKLTPRPCRVTGSTEQHMVEYPVPVDMINNAFNDNQSLKLNSERDATERDCQLLDSLRNPESTVEPDEVKTEPSGDKPPGVIDAAPLADKERLEEKKLGDVTVELRSYQDMMTAMKQVVKAAVGHDYTETFVASAKDHMTMLSRIITVLDAMLSEEPSEAKLADEISTVELTALMTASSGRHEELMKAAARFGIIKASEKRRAAKRPRKSAE